MRPQVRFEKIDTVASFLKKGVRRSWKKLEEVGRSWKELEGVRRR